MLIVLRGNSGSGKTTTAKLLRDKLLESGTSKKVALIEQDYLRRTVLKEKESAGDDIVGLVEQTVDYCLGHSYNVILEGILVAKKYEPMLKNLYQKSSKSYWYYFDISLEETLKRHATKPNAKEFGEPELRAWYQPKDLLSFTSEKIIDESLTQSHIVDKIFQDGNS